jgi:hypothetical protein
MKPFRVLWDIFLICAVLTASMIAVHKMYRDYDFSGIPDQRKENWNVEAALVGYALGRGSK